MWRSTFTILSLLLLAPSAHAGSDCEPEQGWSVLRGLAAGKITAKQLGDGNNDVDLCLLGPRALSGWQDSWYRKPEGKWNWKSVAGNGKAEESERALSACTPAFASEGRDLARSLCIPLLAWWGLKDVAGKSLLAWGDETYECGFPLMFLPELGGEESARAAESAWTQEAWTHCGYGGCSCERAPKAGKKKSSKRRRTAALRRHKLNVLNVLSYVGDTNSLDFIRAQALTDPDPKVVKRGQQSMDSIIDIEAKGLRSKE